LISSCLCRYSRFVLRELLHTCRTVYNSIAINPLISSLSDFPSPLHTRPPSLSPFPAQGPRQTAPSSVRDKSLDCTPYVSTSLPCNPPRATASFVAHRKNRFQVLVPRYPTAHSGHCWIRKRGREGGSASGGRSRAGYMPCVCFRAR
jgi:hypothetical protein